MAKMKTCVIFYVLYSKTQFVLYIQRQVEVSEVMQGYMQVLLDMEQNPDTEPENNIQLSIISKSQLSIIISHSRIS